MQKLREDLGDLASDGSAAEHERGVGKLRRGVDVLARPRRLPGQALDRGDLGRRANGDDQLAPADDPPVDLERAGANDPSTPAVYGDAEGAQLARVLGVVQAVSDLVATGRRGAIRELSLVQTRGPAHRATKSARPITPALAEQMVGHSEAPLDSENLLEKVTGHMHLAPQRLF